MRRRMTGILILLGMIWMGVGDTHADQAAWIQEAEAQKALKLIKKTDGLRNFCAPCGDTAWTELPIKSPEVRKVSDGYFQVFVGDKGLDLAYLYMKSGNKWVNLAMEIGLSVTGVPSSLSSGSDTPDAGADVIDRTLAKCLDAKPSTSGMMECMEIAYRGWDAELNRVYKNLQNQLNEKTRELLKSSQLEWLKYRDEEFSLIEAIYGHFDGTMYQPMIIEDQIKIVKDRVLVLTSYEELFRNHKASSTPD